MHPLLARASSHTPSAPAHAPRACSLDSLALIEIAGADAVSFMQGQITNDIAGAPQGNARLAGYCTAQGRLLATMVLWREPPDPNRADPVLHAIVRRDIAQALVKRLGMFVLRAKAKLTILSTEVAGVYADASDIAEIERELGAELPRQAWQMLLHETGTWISAPASSGLRWWCIAPPSPEDRCEAVSGRLSQGDPNEWAAADIAAGLAWIDASTQDLFIPQTLNLDLIGGISFTKGCYPGQEIVARSHYRGTLKRRMALGTLAGGQAHHVKPPADVFDIRAEGEPCGRIINAATAGERTSVLFEATFDAVANGVLVAGSPQGPAITVGALPYDTRPPTRSS